MFARGRKTQFPHSDTSKRSFSRVNLDAPVLARVGILWVYVISLVPNRALRASTAALQVTQLLLNPRGIVGLISPFVKTRFYKLSWGFLGRVSCSGQSWSLQSFQNNATLFILTACCLTKFSWVPSGLFSQLLVQQVCQVFSQIAGTDLVPAEPYMIINQQKVG